jgi:hypothetical protein
MNMRERPPSRYSSLGYLRGYDAGLVVSESMQRIRVAGTERSGDADSLEPFCLNINLIRAILFVEVLAVI